MFIKDYRAQKQQHISIWLMFIVFLAILIDQTEAKKPLQPKASCLVESDKTGIIQTFEQAKATAKSVKLFQRRSGVISEGGLCYGFSLLASLVTPNDMALVMADDAEDDPKSYSLLAAAYKIQTRVPRAQSLYEYNVPVQVRLRNDSLLEAESADKMILKLSTALAERPEFLPSAGFDSQAAFTKALAKFKNGQIYPVSIHFKAKSSHFILIQKCNNALYAFDPNIGYMRFALPSRFYESLKEIYSQVGLDYMVIDAPVGQDLGIGFKLPFSQTQEQLLVERAIHEDNLELMQLLINNGLDLKRAASHTLLVLEAAKYGSLKILNLFIEKGVALTDIEMEGFSLAAIVARSGHLSILQRLQQAGVNITEVGKNGLTPLRAAAMSGHLDVVNFYLSPEMRKFIDANARSQEGYTAIYDAVRHINFEVVEALLAAGADIELGRYKDSTTPLSMVAELGQILPKKGLPLLNLLLFNRYQRANPMGIQSDDPKVKKILDLAKKQWPEYLKQRKATVFALEVKSDAEVVPLIKLA